MSVLRPLLLFTVVAMLASVCLTASAAQAQAASSQPIAGAQINYLIDREHRLDLDEVRALPEAQWQVNRQETPSFGFVPDTYWYRFPVPASDSDRLLELGYALLDDVELFVLENDQLIQHYQTGDRRFFKARPVEHRLFLFPLPASETSLQVYMRVHTTSAMQVPLELWTERSFFEEDQYTVILHGMYYGIVFVMSLYNLFLLLRLRNSSYAYYVLYVLSFSVGQMAISGFAYQLMWPESPDWNERCIAVLVPLVVASSSAFAGNFLRLRHQYPYLNWGMRGFTWLALLLTVLGLVFSYATMIKFGVLIAILVCIYILGVSLFVTLRTRHKYAVYFTSAWTVFLVAAVMLALNKFGILPRNTLTESSAQIGSALEIILLSFALAERLHDATVNRLRAEQEYRRTNARLIETQREQNVQLEKEVAARTHDLSRVLSQVQDLNEELTRLSRVDQLTGVFNRRHFDQVFEQEFLRGRRNQSPLSVVMVDLDHFKSVNDTYGHQAGDECLHRVAQLVFDSIRRPPDIVCRYGGEELVIVLPDTGLKGAEYLANRIREKITGVSIESGGQAFSITASMGVASVVPGGDLSPATLLAAADKALYQAKEQGRNRVCARALKAEG